MSFSGLTDLPTWAETLGWTERRVQRFVRLGDRSSNPDLKYMISAIGFNIVSFIRDYPERSLEALQSESYSMFKKECTLFSWMKNMLEVDKDGMIIEPTELFLVELDDSVREVYEGYQDGDDAADQISSFNMESFSRVVLADLKMCFSDEVQEICHICLDDIQLNQPMRQLRCGHKGHKACFDSWIDLHRNCPVCRREVGRATDILIDLTGNDDHLNNAIAAEGLLNNASQNNAFGGLQNNAFGTEPQGVAKKDEVAEYEVDNQYFLSMIILVNQLFYFRW